MSRLNPNTKLSKRRIERILQLVDEGRTIKEIAAIIGIQTCSVYHLYRQATGNGYSGAPSAESVEAALERMDNGSSAREEAEKLHCSMSYLYTRYRKKYGSKQNQTRLLSYEDAENIRAARAAGASIYGLAKKYEVHPSTIKQILRFVTYKKP